MRAASCFSGIGSPEVAMPWYDWLWHSEIEGFPNAVMSRRHPGTVNLGDILAHDFIERAKAFGRLDLMVGGPPCQAFSIAGLRQSLSDPRGNLSLRWVQVLDAIRPRNAITENVPGWLSTKDNAFGCFLAAVVGADDPLRSPLEFGRWPDAGMVAGPRARAAWRILDAQHFRLAQRRRRVFVVIDFGDGADPAAVLFERHSLSWNPSPRSKAWQDIAGTLSSRASAGGGLGTDFDLSGGLQAFTPSSHGDYRHGLGTLRASGGDVGEGSEILVAHSLNAKGGSGSGRIDAESETFVTHSLRAEGFDASEDGTGRGIPLTVATLDANYGKLQGCSGQDFGHGHSHLIPIQSVQAVREKRQNGIGIGQDGDSMFTLTGRDRHAVAYRTTGNDGCYELGDLAGCLNTATDPSAQILAFQENQRGELTVNDTASSLKVGGGKPGQGYPAVNAGSTVRRLTPRECERLQGFPDDYTLIPYRGKRAADGPRYRALGNSMAVPVMNWIGRQIQAVENLHLSSGGQA